MQDRRQLAQLASWHTGTLVGTQTGVLRGSSSALDVGVGPVLSCGFSCIWKWIRSMVQLSRPAGMGMAVGW